MAPLKKSRGVSSGYRYKTIGSRGTYKRVPYKKKNIKITLFQETSKSAEYKSLDNAQIDAATPANSNAFTTPVVLNAMLQGTTVGTRIGRKATFRSFQYRMHFSGSTGASGNANAMRVLCVFDKQPNGALAAVTDILITNTFVSPLNLNNSDRFIVISDKVHQAVSNGPTTGECYKKMSLETMYGTNAGTIADINSGAILIMVAQTGAASVTYNLYPRLRFTDS